MSLLCSFQRTIGTKDLFMKRLFDNVNYVTHWENYIYIFCGSFCWVKNFLPVFYFLLLLKGRIHHKINILKSVVGNLLKASSISTYWITNIHYGRLCILLVQNLCLWIVVKYRIYFCSSVRRRIDGWSMITKLKYLIRCLFNSIQI